MRTGIFLNYAGGFLEAVDEVVELEKVGVDIALVAEAYSFDAISQLGFLAARTSRIELGSGVVPIYVRTPSLLAMTAAGLDYVSDGRFRLGIGTSGPQVMEGFHGVPFDSPLGRTREVVEICRQVWRRENVQFDGKHYQIPLPADRGTGLGKPLHLINHPVRERIPITIAALGPKNVELTAEIAEGWQPVFFYPERAGEAWGDALRAGMAKRDPTLGPLDIMVSATLAIGDDVEDRLAWAKPQLALYIGGMGHAARTSTTTSRGATGSATWPTTSRISTCPAARPRRSTPFPMTWSDMYPSSDQRDSSRSDSPHMPRRA
jgi:F420-dependent oxidoreductase-like protein